MCSGGGLVRGFLAGSAVAASVLAYDALLKRYRALGSLAMAACRVTNVLLGPTALGFAFGRRDPAALFYPLVILVRNLIGAFGYAVGLFMKTIGRV